MSSGTDYQPRAGANVSSAMGGRVMEKIQRLGMSPRQQALNHLWMWYRTQHYSPRKIDWDGREHLDPIDHEAIASGGFIPPGFYNAAQDYPLKFRRPTAPYHLVMSIVNKFTELLFAEARHPAFRFAGDPDTEDYAQALADESRLWARFIQARTFGGAMGTVAVGFQFIDGIPKVDVFDPRWITPEFEDRWEFKLRGFEIRYQYPEEVKDPESGKWVENWMWYRRIVDDTKDVLFMPAPVGDGEEPAWVERRSVSHGFGFCPAVWIQNLPVEDDIDGDPDCHGIFDEVEGIDAIYSQAQRGTISNCDPTLAISTDAPMTDIAKGSENAIKLPKDGNAKYVELAGTSIEIAMKMAEKKRELALEVAQCVIENPSDVAKTATEIKRRFSSMHAKGSILREQYGEHGIKPLMKMMLRAARKLGGARIEGGQIVRDVVMLPPRVDNGTAVPRKLGKGQDLMALKWPRFVDPEMADVLTAAQAATTARTGGLLDREHAAVFTAEFFHVEDVKGMVENIEKEQRETQAQVGASAMAMMPPIAGAGGGRGPR